MPGIHFSLGMGWQIRRYERGDEAWLRGSAGDVGGTTVVSRGSVHDLTELPGFVAVEGGGGERGGFAMYRVDGDACELVAIEATERQRGAGTALIEAVESAARDEGCRRLWLITTNDNLDALRFYQRRGFELAAVHRGAAAASRDLKPSIPEIGEFGIRIRDEIELEKLLRG